jgi:predicted nuclease of predicted toxin-antitoxin system
MARFYADEQFPLPVVELLRNLGHDVLTVQEAGNANQRIPDEQVLAFAVSQERAILTIIELILSVCIVVTISISGLWFVRIIVIGNSLQHRLMRR